MNPETKECNLTADDARRLLEYDPGTGTLRWKLRVSQGVRAGDIAGTIDDSGYRTVRIKRRGYRAHRLAFLIVTGHWPANEIDHIDRDRDNNRWSNLRECSHAENMQNHGPHRNNTSGVRGVHWYARLGKWAAQINIDGKRCHIGYFDNLNDAGAAYLRTKNHAHPFSGTRMAS